MQTSVRNREQWSVTVISTVIGVHKPHSVEEDGSYSGYDIEVLQAYLTGFHSTVWICRPQNLMRFFSGLTAGNYQIAVNNFSYNEKRVKVTTILSHMMRLNMYLFRGRWWTTHFFAGCRRQRLQEWGRCRSECHECHWKMEWRKSRITDWDYLHRGRSSVVFEHIQDGTSDFR